jgi:hypothetical protein
VPIRGSGKTDLRRHGEELTEQTRLQCENFSKNVRYIERF